MVIEVLLTELHRVGVRLRIQGDMLQTITPLQTLTPELGAAIREHKPVIMAALKLAEAGQISPSLTPLPEPLKRLIAAATGSHLPTYPVQLERLGLVTDLTGHVLAWAASYSAGGDSAHCLTRLWAAYRAWQEFQKGSGSQ